MSLEDPEMRYAMEGGVGRAGGFWLVSDEEAVAVAVRKRRR